LKSSWKYKPLNADCGKYKERADPFIRRQFGGCDHIASLVSPRLLLLESFSPAQWKHGTP
jgi:hypothetical protein